METSNFVYVLQHTRQSPQGEEDVRLIGVESSEILGRQAMDTLGQCEGF